MTWPPFTMLPPEAQRPAAPQAESAPLAPPRVPHPDANGANGASGARPACDTTRLFKCESDIAGSLRRFPMVVRWKLDRCGVAVSLDDWQRMSIADRCELMQRPIDSPTDRARFMERLRAIINLRCNRDHLEEAVAEGPAEWADPARVPASVIEQLARELPTAVLDDQRWSRLSELERFALTKLARPGHANRGFKALAEELLEQKKGA